LNYPGLLEPTHFKFQETKETIMLKASQTTNRVTHGEKGVALLFCLFALMILTAITAALIMSTGTETSVNANYRTEETAFFAAKTGIYEALDRMQQTNANSIAANVPTAVPSNTGGVLYLINAGSSLTVKPWDETNTYFDTEFCHEGYALTGMTSRPADVPCFKGASDGTHALPTVTTWYSQVSSNYPWSGTSAAMPYEWVRINWKENKTESYISGGTTPAVSNYAVNSGQTATTPACWNNTAEVLLSTPVGVTPAYTSCENYQTCGASNPTLSSPVLIITALAVTSNGSRQMVQAEAALTPPTVNISPCGTSDPYGFFAYSPSCSPPGFDIGGNASVDGYSSAGGGTYATTHTAGKGSIGSNGGVYVHGTSTNVGGKVYVQNLGLPTASPPYSGSCPGVDFSVSGNPTTGPITQSTPLTNPAVTTPASGATNKSAGHAQNLVLAPGNYGTLSVSSGGTITLTAPGTYNVACITASSSGSNITISPANKAVTINVSGTGCTSSPINFGSNTLINNTSGVASNMQINYAGTGTLTFTGGTSMYAVVNAPSAAVVLHGGADFYGTILANTIDDSGGTNLHFDTADTTLNGQAASTATATATGSYNILAFHSLPY
jgi:hypothetical protein